MQADPSQWTSFVALLATMPDVVERLTTEHVPAIDGRCRACTVGGRGTPGPHWPCAPAALATAARRLNRPTG